MEYLNTGVESDTKIVPDTGGDDAKVDDAKDSNAAHMTVKDECHNVCGINFLILATFILIMVILLLRLA